MNTYLIHPIIVHFPIAFLFVYSVIKILPLKKWFPQIAWKEIERVILLIGVLGACVALITGQSAKHLVHPNHALVNMHSLFAQASVWIYGALLLGEAVAIFNQKYASRFKINAGILNFLILIEKILTNNAFSKILALAGFITITITGMLGGVMVYGTGADPLSPLVLKLLGLSV